VVHQLVVGCTQLWVARVGAQARTVDQRLRVFDAEADGERLGLQVHAAPVKHLEGVARAVPDGQHHVMRGDALAAFQQHGLHPAVGDLDVRHLALEADLRAQLLHFVAHPFHHADQAEGADVRFAHIQDLFRRTGLDELGHHLAPEETRVLDAAVQLAVGEGARTALAELHVGLGIEPALAPQGPGVLGAFAHFLAAFQNDGPETHLRQQQPGEDAARAETDHHRALLQTFRRTGDVSVFHVRRGRDVRNLFLQQCGFIRHFHVQRVDEHDEILLARIVTAAKDVVAPECIRADTQPFHDGGFQSVGGMVERQADLGEA